MSLGFHLSVRSVFFFFLSVSEGGKGAVLLLCFFAPPVPEKEILDFIAHGSIVRVFTVP